MTLAHVAGAPLEELLPLAPVAGALWLTLRARARGRRGTSSRRRLAETDRRIAQISPRP